MAVRIVQYLVFTCFLCITCHSVDSNRRFIRQLDIFKREVRDELSFIAVDINTLFESFVGINKTLQNNVNVNKGRPDENNQTHADMDKKNERYVVKKTLFEGLSEKYIELQKAFESEKQLNRELQNQLKLFELEFNSFESEKQFIRELQVRIKSLESGFEAFESEKQFNRKLQNHLKLFEMELKSFEPEKQFNRELQDRIKSFESGFEAFESEKQKTRQLQGRVKSLESEKQVIRELQDRVKSFESDLKSFESELKSFELEKQLTRQLQDRIKGLESEKQLNHELQNRLKAIEDAISGIYAGVVANATSFLNNVNGSQDSIAEKHSNNLEVDHRDEDSVNMPTTTQHPPKSCDATSESGVFGVYIESIGAVKSVYCDAETDGGGWTVIMRRQDGSVDFNRSWTEYKNGFGNADGEFWLGNDLIYALTKSKPRELRIDMHDFNGNKVYAKYDTFEIGSESDKYRLEVAGYSGTAGDAMVDPPFKSVIHNGMQFTTFDSDNDYNSGNCASKYPGGWWFKSCFRAHLTAIYSHVSKIRYAHGIIWAPWKGYTIALKFVEMKIR